MLIHEIAIWLGLENASGPIYSFWSGFGSDLAYLGAIAILWRKVNCHAKGCWRIGLHHVEGTHYITCRKHHPVHAGSKPATAEEIAQAHGRHIRRVSSVG